MPEALGAALAAPGLAWLILVFLAGGLVRGFTGFGTALIVMPVAGRFLPPAEAIVLLTVSGMLTWLAIVPRAWAEADRREVGVLAAGAVMAAPLGVWLLSVLDPAPVRWVVAVAATVTLAALVSGWRYRGRVAWPGLGGVGASAGVLGGLTGLTGPPVVLFYLAGPGRAAQVRANTILFLAILDIGIVANLLARDMVTGRALGLGALLALPYVATILIGQRLFTPEREGFYRAAAYGIIGAAILSGLPLFD
ncbi:putative membrane protein YfcA [Rhodovulum iodosum]|uniref:Probable membrane transporter protein n=1 Tax=Rhodovulum iodosum TaxID=68291 RepID=A0ABV3XYF5_9RHOB|nr:sulfite exporter TauE/SafE family protein [Rhodovulum robiginosum]RSK33498.1 sulfite exporter TauE/SafE family protein [Rhodovulum robiginosum]